MTDIFIKIKTHLEQNLPFVLFSKPNSEKTIGLFQRNDHLYFLDTFEEKGFVFVPFNANDFPFIPLEYSDIYVEKNNSRKHYIENSFLKPDFNYGKDFFEELVEKAINELDDEKFFKVVVSRKEEVEINEFDIEIVFNKMLQMYPSAFKYFFHHPKIGSWFGASPEQLLKTEGSKMSTVALAGTQIASNIKSVTWSSKEVKEQQLVTEFIIDQIEDFVKDTTISSPYTEKAGSLYHIKTDISAHLKTKKSLKNIILSLHPTSAVCGLPKSIAKAFIDENEEYNREYYSGFLGELNIELDTFKTQKTDLFVNLRCGKFKDNKVEIFVGCGITKESNPQAEYIETANKAMTIKKILF
jgi:isochorismate synthase